MWLSIPTLFAFSRSVNANSTRSSTKHEQIVRIHAEHRARRSTADGQERWAPYTENEHMQYPANLHDVCIGPLSVVGDPVGQVVEKGLSPVGHVTGKIGEPNGQAFLDVQKQIKEDVGYTDKTKLDTKGPGGDRIGGNKQTGQNPLGL